MTERMLTLTLTGFTPAGYELSVQMLDVPRTKLTETVTWFDKEAQICGIRPVCGVVDKNGNRTATNGELPECPIHNCAMERHEKGKAVWYSHKVADADGAEQWCRGK